MSAPARPADRLSVLSEEYTYRVNMLLEEGREDLATELVTEYEREAMQLLSRLTRRAG